MNVVMVRNHVKLDLGMLERPESHVKVVISENRGILATIESIVTTVNSTNPDQSAPATIRIDGVPTRTAIRLGKMQPPVETNMTETDNAIAGVAEFMSLHMGV